VGDYLLRQPKDLKQMAELDDGRARLGAEPVEDAARPPMVKPKFAEPPAAAPASAAPAPSPAPASAAAAPAAPAPAAESAQAASSASLDAAIAAVKSFPLDGQRGTVAQWLQFSYSAAPGAGTESWNASETGQKTYLVEYRFTPAARGGEGVHYLFEVDMEHGLVIGKNIDAKSILSSGPRATDAPSASPAKAKAKAKAAPRARKPAKRAAKRAARAARPAPVENKPVPQLPLPSTTELRPPAEDDGSFQTDAVKPAP
jgi:hypothetical protein